mmetsp:Transcript_1343/g.4072  ORF Transcript_1343/g.4072 Transcript_1343/m.4072 type:complete len:369 (-) Transcript_1343:38-1144(-)
MALCGQLRRPLVALALACLAGASRKASWGGCPAQFLQDGAKYVWNGGDQGHGRIQAGFEECPRGASGATSDPTGASLDRPMVGDATLLLQRMKGGSADAMRSFTELRKWSWDGLSFRESWSDEDTEYLRRLDGRPGAWVDGELTTEAVRAVLPTFAELQKLLNRRSIAIVGSGSSAVGKGKEIDMHPVVARFNEYEKYQAVMGSKIDIHAMNSVIVPPSEPNVWQVQLEMVSYFEPLCTQLHRQGRFYNPSQMQHLLFVRPSVKCSVPNMGGWSRGFMFYWFMGSAFPSVDIFGMSSSDGNTHANGVGGTVYEPFLDYEHQIYRQIYEGDKASGPRRASFLNVTRSGRAPAPARPQQHLRFVPQPSWW